MQLEDMVSQALTRDPRQPAFEFARVWHDWGKICQIADTVLALLDRAGTDPAAPIVLAPRTRPAAVAAMLGLVGQGRKIRMAYAFQSATRLLGEIDRCGPAALIAAESDFSPELIAGLAARGIAGIALSDDDAQPVASLERSTAATKDDMPARHIETLTSGTTGKPKPFLLPFETIARHFVTRGPTAGGSIDTGRPRTPVLMSVPLANLSGLYGLFPAAVSGCPVVLADRFSVAEWHYHLTRYRPQIINIPTAALQQVLDANFPADDFASVEAVTTGAAPIDPAAQRVFEERYGIPILVGYGATEFAGSIAQTTLADRREWGDRKLGSAGRVVPGAEMRVVDPDTGDILPAGVEGILEARTNRFGDTAWLRTSDRAVIDGDGFLFHRGRADAAIVRGGFKIPPETIEQALMLHPAVSTAIAAGVADRRLGQVPGVVVRLKPGAVASANALEAHLREHLLATQIPTRWLFVEEMPMTLSNKLDRQAARSLLEAAAEA